MSKELNAAWDTFATKVVEASQRELGTRRIGKNKNYGVATRTLQKSLAYSLTTKNKKITGVQLFATGKAEQYAPFIHWGVNGTNQSRGSMFSFRTKQPPTDAILKWMRVKPVRLRNADGQFVKQTERGLQSAAFLIARSIKRKGIEGLRYFVNGFEYAIQKHGAPLAQAIGEDAVSKLTIRVNSRQSQIKNGR
jgi:hypothetical protein